MKKFIMVLFIVFLTASTALAGWQEDFESDYTANGLDVAVTNALAKGIAPEAIIETAMAMGVDGKALASAMCDGGVPVQALENSLSALGIPIQAVVKACGGGQGNISATGAFPGAAYSTAAKETTTSVPPQNIHPPIPASGNNFGQ
jgi:hypothetical protein